MLFLLKAKAKPQNDTRKKKKIEVLLPNLIDQTQVSNPSSVFPSPVATPKKKIIPEMLMQY